MSPPCILPQETTGEIKIEEVKQVRGKYRNQEKQRPNTEKRQKKPKLKQED